MLNRLELSLIDFLHLQLFISFKTITSTLGFLVTAVLLVERKGLSFSKDQVLPEERILLLCKTKTSFADKGLLENVFPAPISPKCECKHL